MIFTFRFISDEEDSFVIDVNINHDQTFEQLHNSIQETLKYDSSQLASFFISNDEWEKQQEIALVDMGNDADIKIMADTKIEEFFTEKNQRILYVFDYFNERLFFGSVVRTIDAESPIQLPSVSKLEGTIPPQTKEIITDIDTDFDIDDFNDDDMDFNEGFENIDDLEDY